MTTIDQLPVEILMKIFSYLPSYNQVSLVNKRFYDVVCSVSDNCASFGINVCSLKEQKHRSMMKSVQEMKRKISKVRITLADGVRGWDFGEESYKLAIAEIFKILKQFSATIKHFRLKNLQSTRIKIPDFHKLLSLVPNTKHLEIDIVFEKMDNQSEEQVNHEFLRLDQLKILNIYAHGEEFVDAFNILSPGVLQEFTLIYGQFDLDRLTGFFKNQRNIKTVTLEHRYHIDKGVIPYLPRHFLDHLKLESLSCECVTYDNRHVGYVLSKQNQLRSLRLNEVVIDESVFDIITNQLTELVTLEIVLGLLDEIAVELFKGIAKLKKLNKLSIHPCPTQLIEALSQLHNSPITTLRLRAISEKGPLINMMSALANSMPNLKSLKFDHTSVAAITQHFNFVEDLEIPIDCDADTESLSETIDVEKSFNPKLTALRVLRYCEWTRPLFIKLMAIYPNLEHLEILSRTSPTSTTYNLELILNGFKRISSLDLRFCNRWTLTELALDCIIEHKDRLKRIKLNSLRDLSDVQKSKLAAAFHVVEFSYTNLYLQN